VSTEGSHPAEPAADAPAQGATDEPRVPERRDEEGLPLDRPATLDDVRGQSGSGRTIAFGCTLLVALALLGFWGVRALLLG
jgi:hypothetical protein